MKIPALAVALAGATLLAACSALPHHADSHRPGAERPTGQGHRPSAGTPARDPVVVRMLTADGQPAGQAELVDTPQGVQIAIQVQGQAPGPKGFHIHTNGVCAPGPDAATGRVVPFGAAGGHFDPHTTGKHGQPGQPRTQVHAGELPNIPVGADGRGMLRYLNTQVTLAPGEHSIRGRTLVVHAQADDYRSDPAGNSGGRVLCGVIQAAQAPRR